MCQHQHPVVEWWLLKPRRSKLTQQLRPPASRLQPCRQPTPTQSHLLLHFISKLQRLLPWLPAIHLQLLYLQWRNLSQQPSHSSHRQMYLLPCQCLLEAVPSLHQPQARPWCHSSRWCSNPNLFSQAIWEQLVVAISVVDHLFLLIMLIASLLHSCHSNKINMYNKLNRSQWIMATSRTKLLQTITILCRPLVNSSHSCHRRRPSTLTKWTSRLRYSTKVFTPLRWVWIKTTLTMAGRVHSFQTKQLKMPSSKVSIGTCTKVAWTRMETSARTTTTRTVNATTIKRWTITLVRTTTVVLKVVSSHPMDKLLKTFSLLPCQCLSSSILSIKCPWQASSTKCPHK